MSRIYKLEDSINDPVITKSNLTDYEGTVDNRLGELVQKIDEMKQEIMNLLEQIKVKASEQEPEEPEEMTVWFDLETRLVKVRKGGEWIPMGAVYQ